MPITKELKNVKKYETVGFTHEQAETLAETIEESHVDSHESLKEFIQRTIKDSENSLRGEIKEFRSDINTKIADSYTKIAELKYDLLLRVIIVVSTATGLLFAAIKLFT